MPLGVGGSKQEFVEPFERPSALSSTPSARNTVRVQPARFDVELIRKCSRAALRSLRSHLHEDTTHALSASLAGRVGRIGVRTVFVRTQTARSAKYTNIQRSYKMVSNRTAQVEGLNPVHRQAGDSTSPKWLRLGGFPASSHEFPQPDPGARRSLPRSRPDYPGFGNTDMPDDFEYTFDRLSEIVEGLLEQTGFHPFGLYHQDYGGPVGNRIVGRHPGLARVAGDPELERLRGGLHRRLGTSIRHALWIDRSPETEAPLAPFLDKALRAEARLHPGTPRPRAVSAPTTGTWTCTFSSGQARARSSSILVSTTTARTSISTRGAGVPARAQAEDVEPLGARTTSSSRPRAGRRLPA